VLERPFEQVAGPVWRLLGWVEREVARRRKEEELAGEEEGR